MEHKERDSYGENDCQRWAGPAKTNCTSNMLCRVDEETRIFEERKNPKVEDKL